MTNEKSRLVTDAIFGVIDSRITEERNWAKAYLRNNPSDTRRMAEMTAAIAALSAVRSEIWRLHKQGLV